MADDEIQLTSAAEILVLREEWSVAQGTRSAPPKEEYIPKDDREAHSARMHEEYKRSEDERIAKRAQEAADKKLEAAYPKVDGRRLRKPRPLTEEDKRWNKIFEEKHEDKNYYGVRASIGSSCSGLDELPADDGTGHPTTVRR